MLRGVSPGYARKVFDKMLVLKTNSKRQRRPNVRLGEVGDVPAAFACGYSRKNSNILGHNTFQNYPLIHINRANQEHIQGFPLETISPKISADLQNNIENNNPNSSKSAYNTDMANLKLNFGTITRKCRAMKRRNRNTKGANDVFNNVWSSNNRKDCNFNDFSSFSSDECNNHFKTSAKSMEDCQYIANDLSSQSNHVSGEMNFDVNIVSRWLEEKGFGKYAGVFEMHEVDEEALPLLTVEDLKEIGVFAVGSRRKLYTAIQQLRNYVSVETTSE